MTQHKITITPGKSIGLDRIEVDGHDISKAVQRVDICLRPYAPPLVDLELNVHEIQTFEMAEAELLIPTDVRDALIALGWTPPTGDTP